MAIIERWSPVTRDFGLIQTSVNVLTDAFVDWQRGLGIEHTVRTLTGGLSEALEALPPLSQGKKRRLFVGTKSGWTAQFQSGVQDSDPFPVMSLFAERLSILAMRVCSTPEGAPYPANIWEVYAPPELGGSALNYRRSIFAGNDGGRWEFSQAGEPFSFEDASCYSKRRIRDRFTREMLERYLAEFGLFPFRDDFYVVNDIEPAIILQRPDWENEPPEYTLDEVLQGKPWKKT